MVRMTERCTLGRDRVQALQIVADAVSRVPRVPGGNTRMSGAASSLPCGRRVVGDRIGKVLLIPRLVCHGGECRRVSFCRRRADREGVSACFERIDLGVDSRFPQLHGHALCRSISIADPGYGCAAVGFDSLTVVIVSGKDAAEGLAVHKDIGLCSVASFCTNSALAVSGAMHEDIGRWLPTSIPGRMLGFGQFPAVLIFLRYLRDRGYSDAVVPVR